MTRLLLAAALLISSTGLFAAEVVEPVASVHPLHFSDLSSAEHPFWREIAAQTQALAPLSSAGEIETALAQMSAQGPAARLAASAIARAQVDPAALKVLLALHPDLDGARATEAVLARLPAPRDDPSSPLRQLAALSETEPALRRVFDGERFAGLGLADARVGSRGLETSGKRPAFLGRGSFGVVQDHPAVPGAIVKTVAISFEAALMNLDAEPGKVAAQEERTARTLERAGAGPRYMGRNLIDGVPVSVRERVYGETMSKMIYERRFTQDDAALVRALAVRVAAAGVLPNDLKPANVMIGRTLLDPERRAYVVDGGIFAKEGRPVSVEEILNYPVIIGAGFIRDVGYIEKTTTLGASIERGLQRSRPMPRWRRFLETWLDLMNPLGPPA